MSDRDIAEAIRETLGRYGKLTQDAATLREDDNLYALGLTSHATVNVVIGLEDELDIEIPDEMLVKKTFTSISAIRSALEGVAA